jgi:hypothetical protein
MLFVSALLRRLGLSTISAHGRALKLARGFILAFLPFAFNNFGSR